MIRMLLVGYVFAIRSERRICAEIQVNLAYRAHFGDGERGFHSMVSARFV
jgi:transposase